MAAIGFNIINDEVKFTNDVFEVWDLVPRNVLKDTEGNIYIIDVEIKLK